ncbi:hypothetical protein A3D70_00645 [Candidatus Adlerbacteria bacterium RIFCSPHIGHO2_02_FULL_54_18]|uniref:Uncharacterized protein n=1 Tax=Candidatus Adlerbacteria bacterium RIFCSPHIGHO2_02_FULL_54_18 TaxID=1797241 RepID=A0A1F4Y1Y2_9BACT|nr:MAG: hypothetical protein A3D70_00645 [Candidatus Adlerbacteria bacterium RIFCSPHIGHO2_02_FULL_54_18]
MDIEHLTKHQIILLTLLVSFVTSIATGIVTVSLMDQAPPSITRTINQIVEHTIERVVPAAAPASPAIAAATVTKETTVVVKDDDLVAQSIANVQKGMVRIVSKNTPDTLAARGVVVSAKGVVLSDRGILEALGTINFEAILPNGTRVPAVMRIPIGTSTIAVLDLTLSTTSGVVESVSFADSSKLRLGQSVIRIGGTGGDIVGTGVIAKLPDPHSDFIQASVLSSTPGSLIVTLFGEVIGLMTTASSAFGADFYSLTTSP